jgi:hypothetical protein
MPAWPVRFAVEAAFIVGVAVLAWLVSPPTWAIGVVMAGAWLIVVFIEIALSRAPAKAAPAKRQRRPEARPRASATPKARVEPQPVAKHVRRVVPAEAKPQPEQAAAPEPVPAPREPEPEPEPAPAPEPQAKPEQPEPRRPAPSPAADGPRQWNLWNLERLARDHHGDDPGKDEEWAFLFVYLREFADPDGLLPAHFDNLVRESFADLIGSVAR